MDATAMAAVWSVACWTNRLEDAKKTDIYRRLLEPNRKKRPKTD